MTTKRMLLTAVLSLVGAPMAWSQEKLPLPNSGNVTLPLDEYNRLMELAGRPVKRPDLPPVSYTLKSAELKLAVQGDAATGTLQLDGEVLRLGTVRVPLVEGMTVMDARRQGAELPVEQSGGKHVAVLSGPGEFSVTLSVGMPLKVEAGRASLNFLTPAAGTVRLTLDAPGEHTLVNTSAGLVTSRNSSAGRTLAEAVLPPGENVTLFWAVRESTPQPAAPREVRFLSDVKTLVSVSEAELGLTALVEITVIQGDPTQFEIAIPTGYELTGATGSTLDSSEVRNGMLTLRLFEPVQRSHQFLISLARSNPESKAIAPILSVTGSQRETGEVLVEGQGTMELSAKESGSLKRMDLKEVSPYLRGLSRSSLHAAFRYHRQASDAPLLALDWVRFPDSGVLAATASSAVVTTMVTPDGHSLTEIRLTVRNQAQPFLKVALPAGASIVSAEVAGERVKPVQGSDGNRVPLLRAGFRPTGEYTVSFVYMDSGAPFAKKGGSELALPKMDVPVGVVRWEVFLPDRYKVTNFGGDVVQAALMPASSITSYAGNLSKDVQLDSLLPGQLGGFVTDASGASVPRAHITVRNTNSDVSREVSADANGRWLISNVASGRLRIQVQSPGFQSRFLDVEYNSNRPGIYPSRLDVGAAMESITVTASASPVRSAPVVDAKKKEEKRDDQASDNIVNLQKRVAGVLPIAIEVPHAGTSFRFVRPLVVDEETKVTFQYRTK